MNQVGLVSVRANFQLPILSRSGLKIPGGGVGRGVVWCSGLWCGGVEANFSVQLKSKPS